MDTITSGVTPLRQRMLEDMRIRKLEARTQEAYIRAVRKLAAYLHRSPDSATVEDLRNFQLHLVDSGTSPNTLNATLTGLRFFFDVTVGRLKLMAKMQAVKLPRTLPVVLSPQEVARLIARHYGLLANGSRKASLAAAREFLITAPEPTPGAGSAEAVSTDPHVARSTFICRHCGHAMVIVQTFARGAAIRAPPPS